jgi:hypothetical protein
MFPAGILFLTGVALNFWRIPDLQKWRAKTDRLLTSGGKSRYQPMH